MKKYIILRDVSQSAARSGTRGVSVEDFGPSARTAESLARDDLPEPAVESVSLPPHEAEDAARAPEVRAVGEVMPTILLAPVTLEGDAQADADGTPNWGIAAIGADASPFTGAGVRVAVLDTGIDAGHAAFQGMRLICRDFTAGADGGEAVASPPQGWDGHGHGTHCAGTIFGRDVGGARIGVARGVSEALIGKALDDRGRGTTETLFQALQWAIAARVDVISMSICFDFPGVFQDRLAQKWNPRQAASATLVEFTASLRLFDAMMDMVRARAHHNAGTVIVAASGNESVRPDIRIATSVPAAAEGMVSVGALGQRDGRLETAFFSNTDPMLCAPGVRIPSAKPGGGLTFKSGTSMACPHVAGVAALWWEALRGGGTGRSSASDVVAALRARSRSRNVFAAFSRDDNGRGLVTAPGAADV
jgi:subtilisin family serine protease